MSRMYRRLIALAVAFVVTSAVLWPAHAVEIERPVRIGVGGIVPELDPLEFKLTQDAALARLVHEPLFDGGPVRGSDVVDTVRAAARSGGGVPSIVSGISARGQTLTVALKRPSASFARTFLTPLSSSVPYVLENGRARPHAQGIVGAGPYRVVSSSSDRIALVANDAYYRGRPHVRALDIIAFGDANALRNSRLSGDIDVSFGLASGGASSSALTSSANRTYTNALPGVIQMLFATWRPPFDDARVRKAFELATDRLNIATKVFVGQVTAATDYMAPGKWLDAPRRDELIAHVDTANKFLDAAGWRAGSDGIRTRGNHRLEASLAIQPAFERTAVALQAMYRAIGADIEIHSYALNVLLAQTLPNGRFDLAIIGHFGSGEPDLSDAFDCSKGRPSFENAERFCNAALDAAIAAVDETYDERLRRQRYAEVHRIVAREAPIVYLYHPVLMTIAARNIEGISVGPGGVFASAALWHRNDARR